MNFYQKAQKNLSRFLKWLFRIKVVGAENEPETGGCLVLANHISYVDVIALAVSLKRQIRYMAKKELFKVPLLGRLITSLGAFPVDRTGSAVSSLKKSIALLDSGEIVGMFPTGHRYKGKKFSDTRSAMKGGAAMTAFHSKVPILPVFIETKKSRFCLFRPITVHVGKLISYDEMGFVKGGTAEYERVSGIVFDRISGLECAALNPPPKFPPLDSPEGLNG